MMGNVQVLPGVDHAQALLTLIADPKAAKDRLEAIQAATAEHNRTIDEANKASAKAKADRKAADDHIARRHQEIDEKHNWVTDLTAKAETKWAELTGHSAKLDAISKELDAREAAIAKANKDYDEKVAKTEAELNQAAESLDQRALELEEYRARLEADHEHRVEEVECLRHDLEVATEKAHAHEAALKAKHAHLRKIVGDE